MLSNRAPESRDNPTVRNYETKESIVLVVHLKCDHYSRAKDALIEGTCDLEMEPKISIIECAT